MVLPPPSTDWREQVQPDEAARHQAQADALAELQRARSGKHGSGRALHRKGVLGLGARLVVADGLPAHARHGLFATPATHPAWVRLSNGGADRKPDRQPDIRGFAIRVEGVAGDGALGQPTSHQDFLLIDRPVFGFTTSKDFVPLVKAATRGPLAIVGWAYRTYGLRAMFGQLRSLKAGLDRPFPGFAAATFHSAAPIACGPYAARVRLVPRSPSPQPKGDWGPLMTQAVKAGPLRYDLALQFFVDEERTPIEDAAVDWPEDVAPYLRVAELVIDAQDPASPEGQALAARLERAVFDPWQALAAHRPLGEVMRARKAAYYASQRGRDAEG